MQLAICSGQIVFSDANCRNNQGDSGSANVQCVPSSLGSLREPLEFTRGSDKLKVKLKRVRTRLDERRFPIKRRKRDTILRGSSDIFCILGPLEEGHRSGSESGAYRKAHSRKTGCSDAIALILDYERLAAYISTSHSGSVKIKRKPARAPVLRRALRWRTRSWRPLFGRPESGSQWIQFLRYLSGSVRRR